MNQETKQIKKKVKKNIIVSLILGEDRSLPFLQRLWKEQIRFYPKRILLIIISTLFMASLTALYPLVIKRALDMFKDNDSKILYQIPSLVIMVTASRFTTDALSIREAMIRMVNAFGDVITVVSLIASMLYMDWELSLIAALLYPIAAVPIQKLGKRVRKASGNMQEQVGKTSALLNETFSQARTVRVYGMENREIKRLDESFDQLYNATLKIIRGRAKIDPIMEVLGGSAVAAVLGFAGWRAAMGGATLGDFSGFVAALLLAARPLRALGSLNAAMQEGRIN